MQRFKQKLATYQYVFWKSISSFVYYRDVVKARFRFSFAFFALFSFLLGILMSIAISIAIVPDIFTFTSNFQKNARGIYPSNLVIKVKDGKVSTNVSEPFSIPFPLKDVSNKDGLGELANIKYLLTIDTHVNPETGQNQNALIFVTEKTIIFKDRGSAVRMVPVSDFGDVTIDREHFNSLVDSLRGFIRWVPLLVILVIVIVLLLLLPLLRLFTIVLLSLPLALSARLMGLKLSFAKVVQIGLHALTLPTLLQMFLLGFGVQVPIPFFNSILYLLYSLVILSSLRDSPSANESKLHV